MRGLPRHDLVPTVVHLTLLLAISHLCLVLDAALAEALAFEGPATVEILSDAMPI